MVATDSRRSLSRGALAALAAASAFSTGAGSCGEAALSTDRHVLLAPGTLSSDLAEEVAAWGGRLERIHAAAGIAVASGLSDATAEALAHGSGVQAVRELSLPLSSSRHGIAAAPLPASPDSHDPLEAFFRPIQWNMRRIRATAAWREGFLGDPAVSVAVVDSGIDPDHIDLRGLVDAARSVAFVPSLDGPPDWVDDLYHGTHVAGTVVSNGLGTNGVTPHATLIAIKACDQFGRCALGDVLLGILHAADVGADVVNLSLSGSFRRSGRGLFVAALERVVNYATRAGTLVVMSAGNEGRDLRFDENRIRWPCEAHVGLCVSATDRNDLPPFYTNRGTNAISVAAPGGRFDGDAARSSVLAPCSTHSLAIPECRQQGVYLFLDGTSMAAPHVAGAAALLDAEHGGGLDPPRLRALLEQTAEDLGQPGADPVYGKGRIDVCRLVGCQAAE